jgi:hypothetical protein
MNNRVMINNLMRMARISSAGQTPPDRIRALRGSQCHNPTCHEFVVVQAECPQLAELTVQRRKSLRRGFFIDDLHCRRVSTGKRDGALAPRGTSPRKEEMILVDRHGFIRPTNGGRQQCTTLVGHTRSKDPERASTERFRNVQRGAATRSAIEGIHADDRRDAAGGVLVAADSGR